MPRLWGTNENGQCPGLRDRQSVAIAGDARLQVGAVAVSDPALGHGGCLRTQPRSCVSPASSSMSRGTQVPEVETRSPMAISPPRNCAGDWTRLFIGTMIAAWKVGPIRPPCVGLAKSPRSASRLCRMQVTGPGLGQIQLTPPQRLPGRDIVVPYDQLHRCAQAALQIEPQGPVDAVRDRLSAASLYACERRLVLACETSHRKGAVIRQEVDWRSSSS